MSYELPAELPVTSYRLIVTSYELRVTGLSLPVTSWLAAKRPVPQYELRIGHRGMYLLLFRTT